MKINEDVKTKRKKRKRGNAGKKREDNGSVGEAYIKIKSEMCGRKKGNITDG